MKREGQGWLHLSLSRPSSPNPTRVSSSNPSRRWIFSSPSSLRRASRSRPIRTASSASSYVSLVGARRWRWSFERRAFAAPLRIF
jgi:hypothetical protein